MAKNRADLINQTYKVLTKHYQPVVPPERPVLDHLLYACCLENTAYEKADEAFHRVCSVSFDWNEVRVTSVSELASAMKGNAHPRQAAANLRRVLHSIFESQYSFDLEHLKKQNLGKTIKDLEKHFGTTPFTVSYVIQHALSGHSIPLDHGALRVMHIVGVISDDEYEKKAVPGLERAISKTKGIEYGSLLHQLSADLMASPLNPRIKQILLEMNPECSARLPKRKSRKKVAAKKTTKAPAKTKKTTATAQKTEKAAAKKTSKKKVTKKKTVTTKPAKKKVAKKAKQPAKKKSATKKAPAKKKTAKKKTIKKTIKKAIKKATAKKKPVKKKTRASKKLAKKKPR